MKPTAPQLPVPSLPALTFATWPATLPNGQAESDRADQGPQFDAVDVLQGPSRYRRRRRLAPMRRRLEVYFTASQARDFDAWYTIACRQFGGRFMASWLDPVRVWALEIEYTLTPLGQGWRLVGQAIEIGIDRAACAAHLLQVFGAIVWDDGGAALGGQAVTVLQDDGAAADIVADDFDVWLIAKEAC
jgi:hypothetical protein